MTIALLPAQAVGPTPATLYAAAVPATIVAAILTNAGVVPATVTVLIVRAAGDPATVLSGFPLAPGQSYVAVELMGRTLAAGDTLSAATAGKASVLVTLTVSAVTPAAPVLVGVVPGAVGYSPANR